LLALLREEYRISKLTLHSDLRRRAALRRALPCPSSSINKILQNVFMKISNEIFSREYLEDTNKNNIIIYNNMLYMI